MTGRSSPQLDFEYQPAKPMLPDYLIVWTIRLSLLGYGLFLLGFAVTPHLHTWRRVAKWLWVGSCLFFIAHLVAAFQFYHHWSHSHAVEDTAVRTAEMIGWSFGNGILFSYLFALIWVMDAGWWVADSNRYFRRRQFLTYCIHGYMAFIIFNGAIVFEAGIVRWVSVAWCVLLVALCLLRILVRPGRSVSP